MTLPQRFDLVVFDADDTLWRSEDYFRDAEQSYRVLVSPYAVDGVDPVELLHRTEIANVPLSGYGVKAWGLSMIQAAVEATDGTIPARVVAQLVDVAYSLLDHPVELLPGVADTIATLGRDHRLAVITKGDLLHQMRKVRSSGLQHEFERVRVVEEKDIGTYRGVFADWDVDPHRVVMIGNSLRSDVLPIIELGGHGIHIPYHFTWSHEEVDSHPGTHTELDTIAALPAWLAAP